MMDNGSATECSVSQVQNSGSDLEIEQTVPEQGTTLLTTLAGAIWNSGWLLMQALRIPCCWRYAQIVGSHPPIDLRATYSSPLFNHLQDEHVGIHCDEVSCKL
jgi:hypothetical protein